MRHYDIIYEISYFFVISKLFESTSDLVGIYKIVLIKLSR